MAWHDDRDGIAAVGVAHSARSGRLADALSKLGIRDRRAEGDSHQLPPDVLLKRRAGELERHIELPPFARKVLGELLAYRGEWRVGLLPRGVGAPPALVMRHKQTGHKLA